MSEVSAQSVVVLPGLRQHASTVATDDLRDDGPVSSWGEEVLFLLTNLSIAARCACSHRSSDGAVWRESRHCAQRCDMPCLIGYDDVQCWSVVTIRGELNKGSHACAEAEIQVPHVQNDSLIRRSQLLGFIKHTMRLHDVER